LARGAKVKILGGRRYAKEIQRFARKYVSGYGLTSTPTMTPEDVAASVRGLAVAHQTDERVVAADILDEVNKFIEEHVRLGSGDMNAPRMKTPRELLAEGRPDLVAQLYPDGGSVEELLLLLDDEG
jgi:hypothetical protein